MPQIDDFCFCEAGVFQRGFVNVVARCCLRRKAEKVLASDIKFILDKLHLWGSSSNSGSSH